ncbi:hypothetical protein HN51_000855 [Arachis hypogaea]|uniref:Uncharacterized protein n=1 Tax=Arachis hypogaea TaxID=3818 RepID=A0A445EU77_ARAHY|nr:uncharacterized protein LOC112805096 [Arachis hypogaea]QHO48852.1 uncharacterized protein DS421_1g08940 [Arachis hypogaea]RYR79029.1 hypothetical protein Ahy_A01g003898 [Arachis hypogaea]
MCSYYFVATSDQVHYHVRSISLPSRLHPLSNDIEIELKNFELLLASSSSSMDYYSSITISSSVMNADLLTRLVHLYNCVNEQIIGSSLSQKVLLHDQDQEKYLDKVLDMSLVFLDVCGSARELLQLAKEHAQDLQSALRRGKGQDCSSIKSQICDYFCFKKRAKREISKILKSLKKMENNHGFVNSKTHCLSNVSKVLRELSIVTILVLRRVLIFMCPQVLKKKNNIGEWLLLFSRKKRVINSNEIDVFPCTIVRKTNGFVKDDLEIVKRRLEGVDECVRELEAGLGCLFRCLIRHRVSLLNLLTP